MNTAWRFSDGVLITLLAALAVTLSWAPWVDIVGWALRDQEQSHILMGLPIAAWLFWVRRDRLRYARPRRTLLGPVVVTLGYLASRWGFLHDVDLAFHGGALLLVFGAIFTVIGVDFVRQFAPAFVALLFLLPVPGRIREAIAVPLQEKSASISEFFLVLFGSPVTRAGNELNINGHAVQIAEACNGMRMVAALGLVAFAFVYTVPMRWWVRVLILAISPIVAIIVNVIRLIPTTLLYGYAEKHTAEIFHDLSGWGVLLVALALLWSFLAMLRWIEVPIAPYAIAED